MTTIETIIDHITRYDHKFKHKMQLYKVLRVLEKTWDIDDDELQGFLKSLVQSIMQLEKSNKDSIKRYRKLQKKFITTVKRNHSALFHSSITSEGMAIAATSQPGGVNTRAGGAIGSGVLYASNLKYDEESSKKPEKKD